VLVVVVPLDGGGNTGITVADQRQADHRPAGELTLDHVSVHEVLAAQPDAATWIEQFGTLATCAVQLGVAQRALELLTEYLPVRTQFGRPLSDFQAVGQRAADAYTDVWAQELTLKSAAWRFSTGQGAGPEARLDAGLDAGYGTAPDATLDVHLAKLWAARAGQRVVADAVHLHGGTGADRSYPLHRYFLAQTALSAHFGGAGRQLDEIGFLLADAPAGDVV
jgi:acyl-CoA dehydrogenase